MRFTPVLLIATFALAVAVSLVIQRLLMRRLMTDPRGLAPWYNGTGITLYVLGMLVSGLAIGAHIGAAGLGGVR